MRILILLMALLCGATYADVTSVKTYVASQIPDNSSKAITPANVRNSVYSVIDNVGSLATNISTTNLTVSGSTYLGTISATYFVSGTPVALPFSFADEVSVMAFGAKGNGITNDAPAIQAAINWPVSSSIISPKATFKVDSPITVNIASKSYRWNGALWDMRNITSATTVSTSAITFVGQASAGAIYFSQNSFENLSIQGPGRLTGMDGMRFITHNFVTRQINIDGFRRCHVYESESYIIDHYSYAANHCGDAIYMAGGFVNYGEKISYFGGLTANGERGVYMGNPNGDIYLNNMSNDYNINGTGTTPQWVQIDGGRIRADEPHWETSIGTLAAPPIQIANNNGAGLFMNGGIITAIGSSSNASATSIMSIGQLGSAQIRGTFMHNLSLPSGCFKSGAGKAYFYDVANFTTSNMGGCVSQGVSSTENLMLDGGFEKTTMPLTDLIWIGNDSGPIYSQVSGTNVSITLNTSSFVSGTQSLKITKLGGTGTAAGVKIVVPLPYPNAMVAGSFATEKPGTQTGAWFISPQFVRIQYIASNTIPVITSTSTIGTITVNSTSSTLPWATRTLSSIGPNSKAPTGMTHYAIDLNLTSLGAGDINIDNVILGKM